jgi:tetratricopeptide (TPR) repeat protein
MARTHKSQKRRTARTRHSGGPRSKLLKTKLLTTRNNNQAHQAEPISPEVQKQLKAYEEAVQHIQNQKFHKAKQVLEKVAIGPSKELADRARLHIRVCEQRIARQPATNLRGPDDDYHHGVAMMNVGRWDEAREHLERARKNAPRSDYVIYALAALDCLTGEADSAIENLKLAISLRPENRYHARNDEDFAFLQEDPRFTELLYPERESSAG